MAPRGTRSVPLQFARDAVQVLLAALVGALLIKSVVLGAVYVPSRSMEGTLLRGDYLLVNKLLYGARISGRVPLLGQLFSPFRLPGLGAVRRGDVLVFELPPGAFPGAADGPVTFVKRCVGLPGDDRGHGKAGHQADRQKEEQMKALDIAEIVWKSMDVE